MRGNPLLGLLGGRGGGGAGRLGPVGSCFGEYVTDVIYVLRDFQVNVIYVLRAAMPPF